jgi:hypothetical protein
MEQDANPVRALVVLISRWIMRIQAIQTIPTPTSTKRSCRAHSDDEPMYRDNGIEKGKRSHSLVQCVTCMESVRSDKAPKLKCHQRMCRHCLKSLFRPSIKDPDYMPPRCCAQNISLRHVDRLFDESFKRDWNKTKRKFETLYPFYCPCKACSSLIRPEDMHTDKEGATVICLWCNIEAADILVNSRGHAHGLSLSQLD